MRELLLVVGLVALVGYGGTAPEVDAAPEIAPEWRTFKMSDPPPAGSTFKAFSDGWVIHIKPGDGIQLTDVEQAELAELADFI